MNKSQEQMMHIVDYRKELGVPCEVTLKYYHFHTLTDTINIDLNERLDKSMINVFKNTSDYYIMSVTIGNMSFSGIRKYRSKHNQKVFEDIKCYIERNYGEYITNNKRKNVLDDILNDPNPPTLV